MLSTNPNEIGLLIASNGFIQSEPIRLYIIIINIIYLQRQASYSWNYHSLLCNHSRSRSTNTIKYWARQRDVDDIIPSKTENKQFEAQRPNSSDTIARWSELAFGVGNKDNYFLLWWNTFGIESREIFPRKQFILPTNFQSCESSTYRIENIKSCNNIESK